MARTVQLSTTGTATIVLDPVAKSTTVTLTSCGGSSVSVIGVDFSLGDPSQFGGPSLVWAPLSSASAIASSVNIALSWTVLSPLGAVRLNSTATAGSSAVFTLTALQAVTA